MSQGSEVRALVAGTAVLALCAGATVYFASLPQPALVPEVAVALSPPAPKAVPRLADFGSEDASAETRQVANWAADSRDHGANGFVIIDKQRAALYVFDADARLQGSSPVLIGAAVGDESAPGIGSRAAENVRHDEKTTPAGRFLAERGRNLRGEDVVWIDYDAALSIHRVLTIHPQERRPERLATPQVDDNRISSGCVNVPVPFYEAQLRPLFASRRAVVYVLPETKSLQAVFGPSLGPYAIATGG